MNFTLTQLEYIVALDNYKNFAKAAEKCAITQPTLSMQIKKMEDEINFQFFDRSKQPIITTEIGKEIIEQARIILREANQINDIIKNFDNNTEGKLTLGIIPTLAPYLLPYFIGNLKEKYPLFKLHIYELKTQEIIDRLEKDELDIGILATPLHQTNIMEEVLFYEEIKIFAGINHPLTQKKVLDIKDIQRNDIWLLAQGNCFRNQILNICSKDISTKNSIFYESGSLETLKKMVETEGGFTLLPELAVEELSTKQLKYISEFKKAKPLREISMVYARSASKQKLISVLKNIIIESIPPKFTNKKRGKVVEWK